MNVLEKPLISIVLPVWNGEQFLQQSISSVLRQSYSNFELIIVDDCSDDGTAEIIREIAGKDLRVVSVTNSKNLKLPHSLNVGFSYAKGDWFTWTSDDNEMEPNCLELLLSGAQKSNSSFVFCDYKVINEFDEIIRINQTGPVSKIFSENIIGACFLYSRKVAEETGDYDVCRFMYEDYDYWVRAYKLGKSFFHIPQINPYRYRVHGNQLSMTRRLPVGFAKFRFQNSKLIEDPKIRAQTQLSVLHLALRNRNFKLITKVIINLFILHPVTGITCVRNALKRRRR